MNYSLPFAANGSHNWGEREHKQLLSELYIKYITVHDSGRVTLTRPSSCEVCGEKSFRGHRPHTRADKEGGRNGEKGRKSTDSCCSVD